MMTIKGVVLVVGYSRAARGECYVRLSVALGIYYKLIYLRMMVPKRAFFMYIIYKRLYDMMIREPRCL
jgi:hypothetical protein